jgi:CRISPR-associated protein Cmx8
MAKSGKKAVQKKAPAQAQERTEPLTVTWTLQELPSSQHKTGLVGLLLLIRWLLNKPRRQIRGVLRVAALDERTATIEFDVEGLSWLFDEAYAADEVEVERDKPFKDVEPLRVVEREQVDPKKVDKKTGKPVVKQVKKYVYPQVVPAGAFLLDTDPKGPDGAWIKLWRDFVWGVLRAVPATRAPYEVRAAKHDSEEGQDIFEALSAGGDGVVELPSTYFVGAQAATAENVACRDRERFQFLLHFWPFAVGIGVPTFTNREGKSDFIGHTLSFPDVAVLDLFVEEYEGVLRERSPEQAAYLPRQALLDLPGEAGLQFLEALRSRLKASESKKRTADLVVGIDVFHLQREGNNVRLRSTTRVEPLENLQDEYERIRQSFRDPLFRRQVLTNLLEGRDWSHGFDRLFATLPWGHFVRGQRSPDQRPSFFPNDVKTQFERFAHPGAPE